MAYFTFVEKIMIRGREINSQNELDSIFIDPEDEVIKDAIKKCTLKFDKSAFDAAVDSGKYKGSKTERQSILQNLIGNK